MGAVTTLPRGRALTRNDLESMPDDGHRYELIDGILVVTPSPSFRHQQVSFRLGVLLDAACPEDLTVLAALFDVVLAEDTIVQPDLIVARRTDFTERDLPVAPLLAIEVLSPSTRRVDLTLKLSRYEAAACPSFWAVDPDKPAVTVYNLRDGTYVEVAHVEGDEELAVSTPFEVTFTAIGLLA